MSGGVATCLLSLFSIGVASYLGGSCSVAFTFDLFLPLLNGALPSFPGDWYFWPFLASTYESLSCVTLYVDVKWGCCLHLPQLFLYALHLVFLMASVFPPRWLFSPQFMQNSDFFPSFLGRNPPWAPFAWLSPPVISDAFFAVSQAMTFSNSFSSLVPGSFWRSLLACWVPGASLGSLIHPALG